MNETAILGTVFGALWGLVLTLAGVIWATLREQNRGQAARLDKLEAQNTEQETQIGRLDARMVARETAHSEHREDIGDRLTRLETKIDQLLRGGRSLSPYPGAYKTGENR